MSINDYDFDDKDKCLSARYYVTALMPIQWSSTKG